MKLLKRWLLPALTCLIAAAAVLLPPRLSRARDARLLDAVHIEAAAGDRTSTEETTLDQRIGLLYRWATGGSIVSLSQPFSEEELERDIRPFIDDSFDLFCRSVPIIGDNMAQVEADLRAGRLLLRDTESGRSASMIQVRGKTDKTLWGETGTEELLIDEQTGLVLSFSFNGALDVFWDFPSADAVAHASAGTFRGLDEKIAGESVRPYLEYLGVDGELTQLEWDGHGADVKAVAVFTLEGCEAEYRFLVGSNANGVLLSVGPFEAEAGPENDGTSMEIR